MVYFLYIFVFAFIFIFTSDFVLSLKGFSPNGDLKPRQV